jgi:hypothetical protein
VVLLGYWLWGRMDRPASPESLAALALSAGTTDGRLAAAVELTMLKSPAALVQLRRLATECDDPKVKAAALGGLADHRDGESSPLFLTAMASSDQAVRQTGFLGAQKILGFETEKFDFRANDPPEKRDAVLKMMQEQYGERVVRPSPPPSEAGTSAPPANSTPAASPAPAGSPALPPVASASTSPTVPMGPMPTLGVSEYPAINLLVWMCRIFAVIVLLAEVGGVIRLMIGDRHQPGLSKHTKVLNKQPSVGDEVEKAFARNSAGLWTKVAVLVAGGLSVIALLVTAEMIQLAVRIEQKMDWSRAR